MILSFLYVPYTTQHLPECLAKAVYSAFCHGFPKSNKLFNSDKFLSYVTNLTSEWITGIKNNVIGFIPYGMEILVQSLKGCELEWSRPQIINLPPIHTHP